MSILLFLHMHATAASEIEGARDCWNVENSPDIGSWGTGIWCMVVCPRSAAEDVYGSEMALYIFMAAAGVQG